MSAITVSLPMPLYTDGDKEAGLARHYVPVYKDTCSGKHASSISKVIDRIQTGKFKLQFLV